MKLISMAYSNTRTITGKFQGQPSNEPVFRHSDNKTILVNAWEAIRSFKYGYCRAAQTTGHQSIRSF
jgi:hypothetical protein